MREHEYRGKRVDTGQWVTGSCFTRKYKSFILVGWINNTPDYFEVIPETIGEYTGLKDKTGVKIFEGDFIRFGNEIYKIVYEDSCFWITQKEFFSMELYTVLGQGDIRVIGNIHDNPELLKESDNA